jgi:hypothetical protein
MNRIYQGRVTRLEITDSEGDFRVHSHGDPETCPLWQHHALFQDAVNYYLVALGAMAEGSSANRVVRDLRLRLQDSWDSFPRPLYGASSLRNSLRRTLPELSADATLQHAFDFVLAGNESSKEVRSIALALVLAKCSGDAAIQQGGRAYLPRLCDSKNNPTWDYSTESVEAGSGAARLAAIIHGASTPDELARIAGEMDLSWVVKLQPGKSYTGHEAKRRLTESIQFLLASLERPSARLADELARIDGNPIELLRANLESIPSLPDEITIPRNRKAAQDLTFAGIAFKQFPSRVTQCFLKLAIRAPRSSGTQLSKSADEPLFSSLGDDPVRLARGKRGFVFPAFTALAQWRPVSSGEPAWKEFDIAAFKEALKCLNQFSQKTEEREGKLQHARQTLEYMLGSSEDLPKADESGGETGTVCRPGLDPRWPLVAQLETELGENLSEGSWQLSRSSLRGLRDIVALWTKCHAASTTDLQNVVKRYQADEKHKREIGSVQLFLMLCEERYRELWRGDHPVRDDEDSAEEDAIGILSDAISVHLLEGDIKRYREPIRLTPAEANHSRRLFMFSDLTDKLAKVRFGRAPGVGEGSQSEYVETAIAIRLSEKWEESRVRIHFAAPRLHRDELLGGDESRWLQPMIAALGLPLGQPRGVFDSAVALMPDKSDDGRIRHLLNFPVKLEEAPLHGAIGKAALWKGQFNGIKGKNLHLHWPGTAKDATKKNPWWENPEIIRNGFTVLANDLGQRNAGAWALLRITSRRPETARIVRSIGHAGSSEWFAEVVDSGVYRLPGEEQKVQRNGEWTVEKSGDSGRMATGDEYFAACNLARSLGCESVPDWLGGNGERSLPELCDQLIKIANRRLTRLGTYHRWSCFAPEQFDDVGRREGVIAAQIAELDGYQDPVVAGWKDYLVGGDCSGFRSRAGNAFDELRDELEAHLVNLANLTVALRQQRWTWQRRPGGTYGDLLMVEDVGHHPRIRGQRGLSMARLEQLDGLRRLFLRFNRALDRQPGITANFGRADQGRDSGEPCQALLDKIDRMKEQRVNQTAHLILAQALGVRLRAHEISDEERGERDMHGEYDRIAGREPVDFIVIEDLSRYLSSQGRAPSENSRLMKWAHRAVRDKLKMLAEEPFGIPVVETVPSYSSRFHARNGQAGARLHESAGLEPYHIQALEKLAARTEPAERWRAGAARELLAQFKQIADANSIRRTAKKPLYTLYLPKAGGPLFLAARDGKPVQADVNAAINLGLRAIAAPECMEVHRRVRATLDKGKGGYRAKLGNAREKAAFGKDNGIQVLGEISKKFSASVSPNFFHEPDGLLQANGQPLFDRAVLKGRPLVSGLALWSVVNDAIYLRCAELNRERIKRWKLEDDIPL